MKYLYSPGMKYKHYAPKADVTILKGSFDAYRDYIAAHAGDGVWALCFDGEEAQLPVPAISYRDVTLDLLCALSDELPGFKFLGNFREQED